MYFQSKNKPVQSEMDYENKCTIPSPKSSYWKKLQMFELKPDDILTVMLYSGFNQEKCIQALVENMGDVDNTLLQLNSEVQPRKRGKTEIPARKKSMFSLHRFNSQE